MLFFVVCTESILFLVLLFMRYCIIVKCWILFVEKLCDWASILWVCVNYDCAFSMTARHSVTVAREYFMIILFWIFFLTFDFLSVYESESVFVFILLQMFLICVCCYAGVLDPIERVYDVQVCDYSWELDIIKCDNLFELKINWSV